MGMAQMEDEWKTRKTLIERARDPNDSQAWEEFTGYYRSFIRMLLTKLQVAPDDLADLSQDVLLKLWKSLPTMEHGRNDAKFRTWLGTVIRNTVYTHGTQTAARRRREAEAVQPAALPSDLEDIIEREWREHVIERVVERLNDSFSGKAMEVFMMTLDGKPADDIATALELTKDSVYVLRNRVRSRFLRETKRLRSELEFRG
jgi:RNA polymerase sigma factor (sigma-70 family)